LPISFTLVLIVMVQLVSFSLSCDPQAITAMLLHLVYKLVRFYQPASRDQYQTTRASLTIFSLCRVTSGPYLILISSFSAIVAFLILFATFAIGLKCFADFDRGLQSSKVHGGSYQLVARKPGALDGNSPSFLDVNKRPKYSQTGGSTGNMTERQSYNAGTTLGPRISIE